jgi:soluble epoxide hydrolase/lipid-phosphate phosphatase
MRDKVLKPEMSRGMETFIPHLRRRQVETGHWALTEAPEQVNKFIVEWFEEVVFDAKSML